MVHISPKGVAISIKCGFRNIVRNSNDNVCLLHV